jgi:dynein heavy chain
VNCCTLDWFDNWPQDALETVAQLFIADNELVKKEDKISISKLFPIIHGSVQEVCDQFFSEQKRRVYLTPKTFLDALDQFSEQLNHKMQEMKL